MASITSIISLFVLLLATYCYSVPIGTEFQYSTVDSEFTTGHAIGERDSMPFASSFEETTFEPLAHVQRTKGADHDDSSDSDEYTTVHSFPTADKHHKRTYKNSGSPSTDKRWFAAESADRVSGDETQKSEYGSQSLQTRGDEQLNFDITTSYLPTEESKVERDFDTDLVSTVESSTEFNNHAIRFMVRGSDDLVYTEPTSSFDSLAHTTGLLHSRTVPETHEHFEGSREEDYTTFHPRH